MLRNLTVQELINKTKAREANPGGGSIVTLTGILGINLVLMLGELSKLDDVAKERSKKLNDISIKLEKVMEDDVYAFDSVLKALKLPKGDERKEKIQLGYKEATKPPLDTINYLLEALDLCDEILKQGTKNAISDGKIGNDLIYNAIILSFNNVEINAKYIKDFDVDLDEIRKKAEDLYKRNKNIFV
ncbi:MAG: cyclodeaminase/cyclohydrolase family protein [Peptoniphilaceae bacterium]|nr:cyclodeaminase/cyclohydrolase family protein [Peptoniphilaceae bacterium]MDY3738543.1 cyclodeaminase/cyclohydrolase family protein [Peptoniphilaceae bacterium]